MTFRKSQKNVMPLNLSIDLIPIDKVNKFKYLRNTLTQNMLFLYIAINIIFHWHEILLCIKCFCEDPRKSCSHQVYYVYYLSSSSHKPINQLHPTES